MLNSTGNDRPTQAIALFVLGKLANPEAAQVLAQALDQPAALPVADAALGAALAAGQTCAVLWADPAPALAAAMQDRETLPEIALADWQAAARDLLDLQRRHRRRMVLIPEAAVSTDDPETAQQLRDRLGIATALPGLAPVAGDLATLLAGLAVDRIDPLRPLLAELAAAGLYCPSPQITVAHLDDARRWMQDDRRQQEAAKEEFRQTLAASESQRRAAEQASAAETEGLKKRLGQAETAAAAAEQARASADQERELLREQIRQMAQALTDAEAARAVSDADNARTAARIKALAAETEGLKKRLGQADTAAAAAEQARASADQERDLLRDQIRLMAQALTDAEAARTASDADRTRTAARIKALAAETEGLKKRLGQAETAAAAAEQARASVDQDCGLLREQVLLMGQALADLQAARQELARLHADGVAKDQAIAGAVALSHQTAEARDRAEGELAAARVELDRLRLDSEQLQETRAEVDRLAADLAGMHERLIARENDLAALRIWHDEMLASNSWKVTAPFRRASVILGRARN